MGQKIHPLGFRLGITKKHKSQWFAKTNKYPQFVLEDYFLRKILNDRFYNFGIENIEIKRNLDYIKIKIDAVQANRLIGLKEKNVKLLRRLLEKKLQSYRLQNFNVLNLSNFANFKLNSKLACSPVLFKPNSQIILQTPKLNQTPLINKRLQLPVNVNSPKIDIYVNTVKTPMTKANYIADLVVEQLKKRQRFRPTMKKAMRRSQRGNVKGVKIQIAGRLNGNEIARTEWIREGRVPLHTLRADIDYSYKTANTIYGILGVKVWIYNE